VVRAHVRNLCQNRPKKEAQHPPRPQGSSFSPQILPAAYLYDVFTVCIHKGACPDFWSGSPLWKNPVALKFLVWSRRQLVTLQILTSSSFPLVEETHGSSGQCVSYSLIDVWIGFHSLRSFFSWTPTPSEQQQQEQQQQEQQQQQQQDDQEVQVVLELTQRRGIRRPRDICQQLFAFIMSVVGVEPSILATSISQTRFFLESQTVNLKKINSGPPSDFFY